MKKYRETGAAGALLDEYERALEDLKTVLETVSTTALLTVVNGDSDDENCHSIQTILTHVVRSGYTYAICIRKQQGEQLNFRNKQKLGSIQEYMVALDQMFQYNVQLFRDYPDLRIEATDIDHKLVVPWGQLYDVEQLLEHAIVHILRHRRQIERFLWRKAAITGAARRINQKPAIFARLGNKGHFLKNNIPDFSNL